MKHILTTLVGSSLISSAAVINIEMYSGGNMAADSNWEISDNKAGTDGDLDGLIDGTDNNGAILTTDGTAGWQLNDQFTADSSGNLPQLRYTFDNALVSQLDTQGFTLTFTVENLGNRGGIWFGQKAGAFGALAQSRVAIVGAGDIAVDGLLHTVSVVWDGNSLTRTIDGGPATTLTLASNGQEAYTGDSGEARFLVDAGSSTNSGAVWNITSAQITSVPEPTTTSLIGLAGLSFMLRRRRP
ncbi:PEP-CTERM sorting domain-containing protein [Rubritalea tangerina]|uniref:PEP-CTERM sorting domain-containing protein n=1 Tax=Rubritalea tangerina TaxID=430798 RepID=A0ABW4Z701_9BACT